MSLFTGAHHIRETLSAWLDHSPDAVLIGEAVGRGGGFADTTRGLQALHPARVLDTPVGDRSVLGLGVGMALAGRPVCIELPSTRSLLAGAEALSDVAAFSSTAFAPSLTVRVPFQQGLGASLEPTLGALLSALPGVGIHVARAETAEAILRATLGNGVHVVLEDAAGYERRVPSSEAPLGQARVLRSGDHATVITWGRGVEAALEATDALEREGISITVLDAVSLAPLDAALGEHVRRTGRVVTVHTTDASLADHVHAQTLKSAFLYLESPPSGCHADPHVITQTLRSSVHY